MGKVALITGVTGQDGAYLSELLLKKGYTVHGIKRRSSLFNTDRIDHLYQDPHESHVNFRLHYGDLTDSTNLIRIIQETQPDEIYNLAAMSHVHVSFEMPEYTANADGIGTLRILEAVRLLGMIKKTKIYQASTSELYGLVQAVPQSETTPFYPRSPYAVAKLYGYWITVNYREAYGMYATNGILFNHESPLRGETFVTRKITRGVAKIALGFKGKDEKEVGVVVSSANPDFNVPVGKEVVAVDARYYRPTEVDLLIGDPTKAQQKLGWKPVYDLPMLVKEMVLADVQLFRKEKVLKDSGFHVKNQYE